MLIEIRKISFDNKGDELMLHAILRKIEEYYPGAKFAVDERRGSKNDAAISRFGLLRKNGAGNFGLFHSMANRLTPAAVLEKRGVAKGRDIAVVLDATGFAYGDQWPVRYSSELAVLCRQWGKRGVRVILMPKAFGPFTSKEICSAVKTIADNADLIFARERISYEHLVGVTGKRSNILTAPDFTNLVDGITPDDFDTENNRFCIIPNYNMIKKTPKSQSEAYIPFMVKCARCLMEMEASPFLMIQTAKQDSALVREISERAGFHIPLVHEPDTLKIKGIIGTCRGVIGSRFHGLVCALSQGVPALATGWSHKYRMLFEDYGFGEGLMDITEDDGSIRRKIDLIVNPDSRAAVKKILTEKSAELKKQSEEMWEKVRKVIDG